MKEKSRKIMWGITGILIFVSVLVMYKTHRAVPFMMDDLWYATMLSDETPIASFFDIVKSQIWHYNNWGGRSMTHGILQITLLLGERTADVLNVLMTLMLSAMICVVSQHRKMPAFARRHRASGNACVSTCRRPRTDETRKACFVWFWAAMAMMLGLNANWKMSMFWQAGAANYLYITVFILCFVWCYLRELPDGKVTAAEGGLSAEGQSAAQTSPKSLPGILLWIIPLGLLAGWSNENMGPAVWVLSLAVIVLTKREKRKLSLWMVMGNISCLAGSILVVAAPGNFVRSAQVESSEYGFFWQCFLRGYAESAAVTEHLFPALLVLGFMLVLCKGVLKRDLGRRNILLLLCAFLSWGAMALSPHYPDRATFGTLALLVCVVLSLAERVLAEREDLAWPLWGVTALIWLRGMFFCGEFLALTWGWIK